MSYAGTVAEKYAWPKAEAIHTEVIQLPFGLKRGLEVSGQARPPRNTAVISRWYVYAATGVRLENASGMSLRSDGAIVSSGLVACPISSATQHVGIF